MSGFEIPAGDRLPELKVQLKNKDGAVDISGATVAFSMKGPRTISGAAAIVDAPTGVVKYAWAAGDTDTAGDYHAAFRVTFTSGLSQTFRLTFPVSVIR